MTKFELQQINTCIAADNADLRVQLSRMTMERDMLAERLNTISAKPVVAKPEVIATFATKAEAMAMRAKAAAKAAGLGLKRMYSVQWNAATKAFALYRRELSA